MNFDIELEAHRHLVAVREMARDAMDAVDSILICGDGIPELEDHDWRFDPGEWDVGIPSAWVCDACGKVDDQRSPPSYDEDYP